LAFGCIELRVIGSCTEVGEELTGVGLFNWVAIGFLEVEVDGSDLAV